MARGSLRCYSPRQTSLRSLEVLLIKTDVTQKFKGITYQDKILHRSLKVLLTKIRRHAEARGVTY
jgi:hypothetical protein